MEYVFQLLLFFFIYIAISSYAAADLLVNPDFEIPPSNATANATTSRPWLLTGANSLPGWSLNGTVWYVSTSEGHALQLGPNAKINQTIKTTGGNEGLDYILTFTLAAQHQDCSNNLTALNVTLRNSQKTTASRLFHLQQNSTRNLWERHALFLGRMAGGEYVHLQIESVASKSNVTCWPLVDAFAVNKNQMPSWYSGNMLSNGGFEVGPAFLNNSADGIILTEEEDVFNSPLQEWSIIGTLKYIDSRHYRVPRGGAAVELLSGDPCGIRRDVLDLSTTYTYTLSFTLGDANDSCVGEFTVYVQVGSKRYNFSMQSNGTGSAVKQTLKFKGDELESETRTFITFYSFDEARSRDGLMCGPVLDNIFLGGSDGERNGIDQGSYGEGKQVSKGILLLSFLINAFVMMVTQF